MSISDKLINSLKLISQKKEFRNLYDNYMTNLEEIYYYMDSFEDSIETDSLKSGDFRDFIISNNDLTEKEYRNLFSSCALSLILSSMNKINVQPMNYIELNMLAYLIIKITKTIEIITESNKNKNFDIRVFERKVNNISGEMDMVNEEKTSEISKSVEKFPECLNDILTIFMIMSLSDFDDQVISNKIENLIKKEYDEITYKTILSVFINMEFVSPELDEQLDKIMSTFKEKIFNMQ